jgi:hypothetical protein
LTTCFSLYHAVGLTFWAEEKCALAQKRFLACLKKFKMTGMVAHIYYFSYSGDRDREG